MKKKEAVTFECAEQTKVVHEKRKDTEDTSEASHFQSSQGKLPEPKSVSFSIDEEEAIQRAASGYICHHEVVIQGDRRFYQWLQDRVKGESKYNSNWGRPPTFLCFVPLPVLWFADYIEMNYIFEWIGRRGCLDPENPKLRRRIFTVALASNFLSMILTFLACFAITSKFERVLEFAPFTQGIIRVQGNGNQQNTYFHLGLRSVYVENARNGHKMLSFDEFCTISQDEAFISRQDCQECQDSSFPIQISLVLSLVFTIPNITTNFLRMWPNYDVNCQKFFGGVVGLISLFTSCYSWWAYQISCFNQFNQGQVILPNEFGGEAIILDPEWRAGFGLIFVVVATFLKMVDSICNWLIPTPSITRNHIEQEEYEKMTLEQRRMSTFDRLHQFHRSREVLNRNKSFGMITVEEIEPYRGSHLCTEEDCTAAT